MIFNSMDISVHCVLVVWYVQVWKHVHVHLQEVSWIIPFSEANSWIRIVEIYLQEVNWHSATGILPLLIFHFGTALIHTRALRGRHSVAVPSVVPGAAPVPDFCSPQGGVRGQLEPSSRALTGLPGTGGAGGPDVVPRQNEPPWRWKTAERRRGLPGS